MPRYVALLRAINVGGHVVRMNRLREIFEALKLRNVATFIASGNVLFDSPGADTAALERKIEHALEQALGYEVATFLRTPEQLAAVVTHKAFPGKATEGCTLSIAFLRGRPAEGVSSRLASMQTEIDALHLHDRELYWLCKGRTSDSKIWRTPLEKVVGVQATSRNITTVRQLAALAASH